MTGNDEHVEMRSETPEADPALARLEEMGLLDSRWEDDPPDGRPRRRLYELTAAGARAAATAPSPVVEPKVRRGLAPGTA